MPAIIEQIGSPLELYNRPGNVFVAGFLGSPRMNFFKARAIDGTEPGARRAVEGLRSVALPASAPRCRRRRRRRRAAASSLGVRPESFRWGQRRRLRRRAHRQGGREPRARDAALCRRRAARRRPIRNAQQQGYIAVHQASQQSHLRRCADPAHRRPRATSSSSTRPAEPSAFPTAGRPRH